jgi:hypothetical protein
MKRYSFDGSLNTRGRARHGIAALALLCCTAPAAAHAALTVPAALRVADADSSATRFLSPTEVEDGVRIRMQQLETRHQSRGSRSESEAPRDYNIDQPPAGADVPLPADASGGEIFEERLEVMP